MTLSRLEIPEGDFKAYLFDCDGTIADTIPLHYRAWNEALAPWGCRFERDLFQAWAGIPIPRTVEMLNERFGLSMPVAAIVEKRESIYHELLPMIRPVDSVLEQVELKFGVIPLAVVSGSPRNSLMRTLNALGISERFQVIVAGDDCSRGKPHPDPFLKAASELGIDAGDCLVFEDADLGIEAAKAAGMAWVKVPQLSLDTRLILV